MSVFKADLSLIFVTLFWGMTFPAMKDALSGIGSFSFTMLRFGLASLCLLVYIWPKRHGLNRSLIRSGSIIGLFLFLGYCFQVVGLNTTSASNAAFINGMTVVLVPLLNLLVNHEKPSGQVIFGVALATVGLALLSLNGAVGINSGDVLVLIGAFFFALMIVFVGKFSPQYDADLLAFVQVLVVAVGSGLCVMFTETLPAQLTPRIWGALLLCAIPATAVAYVIQNNMQRFTSANHTALIFSLEPVFGALFSYLWLNELMTTRGFIGCILVFLGMICAEITFKSPIPPKEELSYEVPKI